MRKDLLHADDIGYRGPFSYRGIRIFALLAMTISQVAAIFLGCYTLAGYFGADVP